MPRVITNRGGVRPRYRGRGWGWGYPPVILMAENPYCETMLGNKPYYGVISGGRCIPTDPISNFAEDLTSANGVTTVGDLRAYYALLVDNNPKGVIKGIASIGGSISNFAKEGEIVDYLMTMSEKKGKKVVIKMLQSVPWDETNPNYTNSPQFQQSFLQYAEDLRKEGKLAMEGNSNSVGGSIKSAFEDFGDILSGTKTTTQTVTRTTTAGAVDPKKIRTITFVGLGIGLVLATVILLVKK